MALVPDGNAYLDGALGLVTDAAAATSSSYRMTVPASLQLQFPFSLFWIGVSFTDIEANSHIFGATYDNAGNSPYATYELGCDANKFAAFNYNTAGTFHQISGSGVVTPRGRLTLGATAASGSQMLYLYGAQTGSTATAAGTINYSATSILSFGNPSGYSSRNAGIASTMGLVYNRILSPAEISWLNWQGEDLFARKRDWSGWVAAMDASQGGGTSNASYFGPTYWGGSYYGQSYWGTTAVIVSAGPPVYADPRAGVVLSSGLAPVNADPRAGVLLNAGNAPINADPRAGYLIQ